MCNSQSIKPFNMKSASASQMNTLCPAKSSMSFTVNLTPWYSWARKGFRQSYKKGNKKALMKKTKIKKKAFYWRYSEIPRPYLKKSTLKSVNACYWLLTSV